jgi:hypothetical protein
MQLDTRHYNVMREMNLKPGWRPAWRGALTRCRELERAGLAKECGIAAMPPHVVFALSEAGYDALLAHLRTNRS